MNNPVLRNYRTRMAYVGLWIIITIVQALTVHLASGLSFGYAFADSFVFNTLYACLIVPMWYPVYYNRQKDRSWYVNIAIHVVCAALLLLSLWLGSSCMLMYLLFGGDKTYLHFMVLSVWWKLIEGIFFYIVFVLVCYLYIYIERLNEKMRNEIRLNQLIKDGELNLLKSQINPHFLFNSLHSVNSLIIANPGKAQEMLAALSDYLRHTVLSTKQVNSGLQEELENIERYLSIEKLRFGDKLDYELDVEPDCHLVKIPAMLLQPLFENAIKHGVYESTDTVRITAKAWRNNAHLYIEVCNDCDSNNPAPIKGAGVGLKNIGERLRLSYGNDAASLQTRLTDGTFTATLKIPIV